MTLKYSESFIDINIQDKNINLGRCNMDAMYAMDAAIQHLPEKVKACFPISGGKWGVFTSKIKGLTRNECYKFYKFIDKNSDSFENADRLKAIGCLREKIFKRSKSDILHDSKIIKAAAITHKLNETEASLFNFVIEKIYSSLKDQPLTQEINLIKKYSLRLDPHLKKDLLFLDKNKQIYGCNFLLAVATAESVKELLNNPSRTFNLNCSGLVVQALVHYLSHSALKSEQLSDEDLNELQKQATGFKLEELGALCEQEKLKRIRTPWQQPEQRPQPQQFTQPQPHPQNPQYPRSRPHSHAQRYEQCSHSYSHPYAQHSSNFQTHSQPQPQPNLGQRRKSIEESIRDLNNKHKELYLEFNWGEVSVEIKEPKPDLHILFHKCNSLLGTVKFNRKDALKNFFDNCPHELFFANVHTINLEECADLTADFVTYLFFKFPKLTSVIISNQTFRLNELNFEGMKGLKNLMIVGLPQNAEVALPSNLVQNIIIVRDSSDNTVPVQLKDSSLYIELPLNKPVNLDFSSFPSYVNDGLLQMIKTKRPKILELNLSNSTVKDSSIYDLLNVSPSLRSLNLQNCVGVKDRAIAPLERCHQLLGLNLANCSYITDAGLAFVKAPLQALDISGCTSLTEFSFNHIAFYNSNSLHWFGYGGNSVSIPMAAIVDNRFANLTNLKLFSVQYDPFTLSLLQKPKIQSIKIEKSIIPHVSFLNPRISNIHFEYCLFDQQKYLDYLTIPSLKALGLNHSAIAYTDLAELKPLGLENLDISSSHNLSIDGFKHFFKNLPYINVLHANFCEAVWSTIEELEFSCPFLKELSLRNTGIIGRERLELIAKHLPKLQVLDLRGCNIDQKILSAFRAQFPLLEVKV